MFYFICSAYDMNVYDNRQNDDDSVDNNSCYSQSPSPEHSLLGQNRGNMSKVGSNNIQDQHRLKIRAPIRDLSYRSVLSRLTIISSYYSLYFLSIINKHNKNGLAKAIFCPYIDFFLCLGLC